MRKGFTVGEKRSAREGDSLRGRAATQKKGRWESGNGRQWMVEASNGGS
jgi:hypothetical protein